MSMTEAGRRFLETERELYLERKGPVELDIKKRRRRCPLPDCGAVRLNLSAHLRHVHGWTGSNVIALRNA